MLEKLRLIFYDSGTPEQGPVYLGFARGLSNRMADPPAHDRSGSPYLNSPKNMSGDLTKFLAKGLSLQRKSIKPGHHLRPWNYALHLCIDYLAVDGDRLQTP